MTTTDQVESNKELKEVARQEYKYGFVTDIEHETAPRGLTEDTVRWISARKNEPEFMLEWRPQGLPSLGIPGREAAAP